MHPICPVQKRIENYFTKVWRKSFLQRWQVQTKWVSSGKTILNQLKKSQDLWEYTLSSTARFIKTFSLSLGDQKSENADWRIHVPAMRWTSSEKLD